MKFNWLTLIELILGSAEAVVPIFIHNPQSQKIEAIVVTTANDAIATLAASSLAAAAAPAPALSAASK
jgi:hypothetical protein